MQETQREGAKAPQGPRPLSETAEGLGKATHLCGSRCHRDHLAVEPSDARICPSAHSREPRATHASAKPPGCQLKPRVRGQDAHPKPLPHIKRPRSQEMFAALMTHALLYKKLLKQELPCVRLPGGLVALSVAPSPQRAPCSRPPPSSPPLSPGQSGPGGSLAVLLGRDSLGGLTLMAKSSIIRHVTPKFRPPVAFPRPPARPPPHTQLPLGHLLRGGITNFTFQTGTRSPGPLLLHCSTRTGSPQNSQFPTATPCCPPCPSPPTPAIHGPQTRKRSQNTIQVLLAPCLKPSSGFPPNLG